MPRSCSASRRATTIPSSRSSTTWGRNGRRREAASGRGHPFHFTRPSPSWRARSQRAGSGASPPSTCEERAAQALGRTRALLPRARLLLEPLLELLAHLLLRGEVLLELLRREDAAELALLGLVQPAQLAHLDE